jgi:hypothetical protein
MNIEQSIGEDAKICTAKIAEEIKFILCLRELRCLREPGDLCGWT